MNASSARLRFRLRPLTNFLIVLILFVPAAIAFSLFPWSWLADAAVIAVLFYFFFFILDKRAIGFRCPHCLKHIASNTPWVCGFCKKDNRNVDEYPFVHRCEHCGAEPRAYKCHYNKCGKLIFLTKDELEANYAVCVNLDVAPLLEDKAATRKDAKDAKIHELEIAELDAKLKEIQARIQGPKIKTPLEQKQEVFEREYAGIMGIREHARQRKAEVAITFKDHPDLLAEANETIDEIVSRHA